MNDNLTLLFAVLALIVFTFIFVIRWIGYDAIQELFKDIDDDNDDDIHKVNY